MKREIVRLLQDEIYTPFWNVIENTYRDRVCQEIPLSYIQFKRENEAFMEICKGCQNFRFPTVRHYLTIFSILDA